MPTDTDLTPQPADTALAEPADKLPVNSPHLSLVVSRDTPNADRLNAQWQLLQSTARNMLEQAIQFGDMLIAEHRFLERPEWVQWVKANCAFSYESAAAYTRLARNKEKFSALNFSSMRQAIAFLDEEKRTDEPELKPDKKAKPRPRKADPDLALEDLVPEQRKLVTALVGIRVDDKVRAMTEKVAAADAREKALDEREAQLSAREKQLDAREAKIAAREKKRPERTRSPVPESPSVTSPFFQQLSRLEGYHFLEAGILLTSIVFLCFTAFAEDFDNDDSSI